MAATSFTVRQFFNIPSDFGTFTAPTGVFVVTGSQSRLLVNNNRTNLASDSMSITTENSSPFAATSASPQGWWPGASTAFTPPEFGGGGTMPGVIVGGNDGYANTSPDGRTSKVSVYGFSAEYEDPAPIEGNQGTLDTEFINLVNYILGTSWNPIFPTDDLNNAKESLIEAGFYYQYPQGFNGQSPNTGDGSDGGKTL